jgi:hypothetical protein
MAEFSLEVGSLPASHAHSLSGKGRLSQFKPVFEVPVIEAADHKPFSIRCLRLFDELFSELQNRRHVIV